MDPLGPYVAAILLGREQCLCKHVRLCAGTARGAYRRHFTNGDGERAAIATAAIFCYRFNRFLSAILCCTYVRFSSGTPANLTMAAVPCRCGNL